eukprot:TRINITY_DN858_c0_g1_i13.p1 TRINITY_DN858_c0_g1~~TRINITY_DN858_c0_g1_i13.p1  ORF type:complete len:149 (-),score=21.78 TRINITY_DN858_c0_g1_i13:35-481(-)
MSFFHELAACLRGKRFLHHMRNRENQFDDLNDPQRTESFVLPLFHQSIRFTSITELHSSLLMNAIRIGKREKSFWTQIAQITSIRRWDICDGYLTEEGFEVVLNNCIPQEGIHAIIRSGVHLKDLNLTGTPSSCVIMHLLNYICNRSN